jgi:RNA polymerase sigma-70 factor (ECF subfamily)
MSSSAARYFPGILLKRKGPAVEASDSGDDLMAGAEETKAAEEVTDEALIGRLQNQEVEALGLLYRRYARLVYSVCFRILRDSAEAEDLVHEVFLSLLRKCRSFDPNRGAARSWLIQLTYSKCFDWRDYLKARHGQRQGSDLADAKVVEIPERAHDPDPAYFVFWNASMVEAFKALSREQRLTLELFYFRGYKLQEVADRLGYSYGNVKHHVYRGVERLRQILYDGAGKPVPQQANQGTHSESQEVAR